MRRNLLLILVLVGSSAWCGAFELRDTDVVAFVGGGDVSAAQKTGHLETLLALRWPGARFRDFGWEGDTAFKQPRDVNFPMIQEQLREAGATVILVQYGRTEALDPKISPKDFSLAYEAMLSDFAKVTPRVVLLTPVPFENPGGLLPDLSAKNPALAKFAQVIRGTGRERHLEVIDLFSALSTNHERLTDDGLQITPRGHALVAAAFARAAGLGESAAAAGTLNQNAAWSNAAYEKVRALVIQKNRLWFNYSRPQNWAFLGGDRTEQPSSRDYRNPKIRWFPSEMQLYPALIKESESQITAAAASAARK